MTHSLDGQSDQGRYEQRIFPSKEIRIVAVSKKKVNKIHGGMRDETSAFTVTGW